MNVVIVFLAVNRNILDLNDMPTARIYDHNPYSERKLK